MRFMPALLLVASTTLAGCGSGDGGGSAASGSSASAPADAFTLSSSSVTFNASQGGSAPGRQFVGVAWTGPVYFNTSQTGTMFNHSFTLNIGTGAYAFAIDPAAPTEVGSFIGTITVNACSNATGPCNHIPGSPKTINVAYNVAGLSITPAQATFSSTDLNRIRQIVTLAITGGSPYWSVGPQPPGWLWYRPWYVPSDSLTVFPDTLPADTLGLYVNPRGLPAGVYSATVTISTPPSFITPMTVTLIVGEPSVNFVAPYVVPAGAGGSVIIRGRGFSALSAGSLSVQLNSTPAITAIVVSDTEIQATYPPLAAGSYSISVSSGTTSIPSRAALKLVVVNAPAFALTTITRPASAGRPENLIYDAERQALLFIDRQANLILRYFAMSGHWSGTSRTTSGPIGGIALSPDGTELFQTQPGILFRLDPVTLAVLSSASAAVYASSFAFANDGGAIVPGGGTGLYRYDMLMRAFTPVSFQSHMPSRQIFASADGDTLVLPYYRADPADKRVYTYDASTGALTPRQVTTSSLNALSMSRDAMRMILVNDSSPTPITVYDKDFNALGTLPNGASTFVLSPDGNFAYAYYPLEGSVRKFDLSAGSVTEVGTRSALAPPNTEMSEMTISPDGGTLFLAGTTSVVIAPAP